MTSMRCALRPSGAMGTGAGRRLVRVVATALVLAAAGLPSARAQLLPAPAPTPTPGLTIISSEISAGAAASNLGSSFLERLGNQATNGANRVGRTNPGGGGASEAAEAPKLRAWGEAYGISAWTESQGDFAGDRRTTWGGVAGIGATIAPGVNVGFSVDQSRSKIDVPLAFQSAMLDLTQLGANFSVDNGPWPAPSSTVSARSIHRATPELALRPPATGP